MASNRKVGGPADIHNEYTPVKKFNKNDKVIWDRKCNHCELVMCRNIPTMVSHTNDKCSGINACICPLLHEHAWINI